MTPGNIRSGPHVPCVDRRRRWRTGQTLAVLVLLLLAGACGGGTVTLRAAPPPPLPAGTTQLASVPPAGLDAPMTISYGQLATLVHGTARPGAFTGINGYDLTSDWSVNGGCGYGGWTPASLDRFFSALPAGSLVRTWFFRPLADTDGMRDWEALDRLVDVAGRHHIHLVAVLANQDGACDDDGWKTPGWYSGGYRSAAPGDESFTGWVHDVVSRYARSRVVGIWEPVNEPDPLQCNPGLDCYSQGTCPNTSDVNRDLIDFFDAVGGEIHALDPGSLVADGSLGSGDCGTATPAAFGRVLASPGLDVTDYHDYGPTTTTVPGDLPRRVAQARALGKAAIVGEAGVSGCSSAAARADIFRRKIAGAFAVGVTGYLPWDYDSDGGQPGCDTPIDIDSPTWAVLTRVAWRPPHPPAHTPAHELRPPGAHG